MTNPPYALILAGGSGEGTVGSSYPYGTTNWGARVGLRCVMSRRASSVGKCSRRRVAPRLGNSWSLTAATSGFWIVISNRSR